MTCVSQMSIKIPTHTAKYSTLCSNFDLINVSPVKCVVDIMYFCHILVASHVYRKTTPEKLRLNHKHESFRVVRFLISFAIGVLLKLWTIGKKLINHDPLHKRTERCCLFFKRTQLNLNKKRYFLVEMLQVWIVLNNLA